jgi:EAL domain-containing protein (putative c-di-GMP-specific phosphodiesterase class I)
MTNFAPVLAALNSGEFSLHYQPKYNVKISAVTGMEALIRWGRRSPAEFLPIFEENDDELHLLSFVLETVAKDIKLVECSKIRISVNITPIDLSNPNLINVIVDKIIKNGIPPDKIVFEITETFSLKHNQSAKNVVIMLHSLGFRLSIDDFGTGHSCFHYLKYFPVHELKIDRLFVSDMLNNKFDRYLVKSLIQLTKEFGWTSVAEGVEDLPTLLALENMGIDEVQGYYFSKPLPIEEVIFIIKDCNSVSHPVIR